LPQEWIDRIEAMAAREERTRQAQVRWLLRQALEQVELATPSATDVLEVADAGR
jgi:hypothetical protein